MYEITIHFTHNNTQTLLIPEAEINNFVSSVKNGIYYNKDDKIGYIINLEKFLSMSMRPQPLAQHAETPTETQPKEKKEKKAGKRRRKTKITANENPPV